VNEWDLRETKQKRYQQLKGELKKGDRSTFWSPLLYSYFLGQIPPLSSDKEEQRIAVDDLKNL
jgi:hypothetical protein